MSFRKRAEPLAPGRTPMGASPLVSGRAPLGGRVPITGGLNRAPPTLAQAKKPESSDIVSANPGVRPSSSTSDPTISTGCADLDRILAHQGLPLGHSLLVEESGSTDFASVLLRAFAAQGIFHDRLEKDKSFCHVVVVGAPEAWINDLPGEYKGGSKEQKRARIAADSSKVSVSNMADKDLKIAWRYGLQKKGNGAAEEEKPNDTVYEHYTTQFDITQRLVPGASSQEVSFVPLSANYQSIVSHIRKIVQKQIENSPAKVVRIVVPGFLNPSIYPPSASASTFIVPLFHSLQSLLRTFSKNAALIASIPLDLYPRESVLTSLFEQFADGVVYLQPFNQEMEALLERAYKNEPSKIQQGLVNVIKVPILSAKGMMMIRDGEYAFRNGRKRFAIEEWGIPVDDTEEEEPQTKQNIDF
ncbi:Elongator subunit elp4 [Candidozyma auris]|uniref:Elongator complex protein 4 n=2 Tax=Candidozyma auris TaxID=498019 RepID=A0A2H0ZNC6_CANAR|nr:hypothetical protein QG37_00943 [[Candida] auris]PIS52134.1 hypothetical protein B9J08_003745 [[Candida] auris]QWW21565.1 hypothetical protein CA7LBN_000311 [[Candida] auris]